MGLIKKNFIYNNILGLSNIIYPLVTFPYASRILGPEGIGITSFAVSLSTFFIVLCSLGIPIYGVREIAKQRGDKIKLSLTYSELLVIQTIWTIVIIIIYMLFLFITGTYKNEVMIKNLSYIHLLSSAGIVNWFFQGIENYRFIAVLNFISKFFGILLLFVLVNDLNDYWIYYLLFVFTSIVSSVFGIFYSLKHTQFKLKGLKFKKHIKPIAILFGTQLAMSLYVNLDIIMLKYLSNSYEVGYYTAAIKMVKTSLLVVSSLGLVMIPRISLYFEQNKINEVKKLIEKSIQFVFLIGMPLMVGFLILAEDLVFLFAGNQFINSTLLIYISAPLIIIIGLSNVFGLQILVPINQEKKLLYSVLIGAVLNFSLNLIFIPLFAAKGVAISTVITEIVVMIILFYFSYKRLKFDFPIKKGVIYVLLALMFFPLGLLIDAFFDKIYSSILIIISSSIIYTVALIVINDSFFIKNILNPILKKINYEI